MTDVDSHLSKYVLSQKVLRTTTKTQAIVSSLFLKNVQDRILEDVENQVVQEEKKARQAVF